MRPKDERRRDENPPRRKPDTHKPKSKPTAKTTGNHDDTRFSSDENPPRKLPATFKPKPKPANKTTVNNDDMRLNRYVAHAGIAARRKADELIQDGQVTVNDTVVTEPGFRVKAKDVVKYKGKVIKPKEDFVYILLNKPKNIVTTVEDERDRRTVMELVKEATTERIFPVGRLDRNTTGLLLLTNDGDLALRMTHPSHRLKKVYHVSLNKPLLSHHKDAIANTIDLEDGPVPVDDISFIEGRGHEEVGISVHVGRNRIVRRIFEHLGYEVIKLDRVLLGPLTKKDLPRGEWRNLTAKEVVLLKHF